MDKAKGLVYIQSQLLSAQIEMYAMVAANNQRQVEGSSMAYGDSDFMELIDRYRLGHNSILEELTCLS